MRRHDGLAGLFGLDAIFNEINCRNEGTTEVSGVNHLLRGLLLFLAAHLTVLLGQRPGRLPDTDTDNQETLAVAARPQRGPFYLKPRHRSAAPVRLTGPRTRGG